MGVKIGDNASRFELMGWKEPDAERIRAGFVDHDEALRFLQRHLAAVEVMAAVRRWGFDLGLHHPNDRGFLQQLAGAISLGQIWVAEQPRNAGGWGGGSGPGPDPNKDGPGPKPGPRPKPKPKPVAELLVVVKTLSGAPVEGATVEVQGMTSLKTDKNGHANYGRVTPGTYQITAAKPGHGKVRNGPEEKDEKKAVSVPDGSKTVVDMIQHPECATVAFFEGSKVRNNYFGFDYKTNLKAGPNDAYWIPMRPKGTLKFPTDRMFRDEARWVSVAVGQEAEVEIHYGFEGADCIPCLANSTFEVIPANVAEVVTAHIATKHAWFRIKGLAVGEASVKVVCDGNPIGWFHIWCEEEVELLVDMANIVTTRAPMPGFAADTVEKLTNTLYHVYRQALIKIDLRNLGTIDLSADEALAATEVQAYPEGKKHLDGVSDAARNSHLGALDDAAQAAVAARTTGLKGRAGARRMYFYVPSVGSVWGGMAIEIGMRPAFVFYNNGGYNETFAHELGHTLNLRHPNDDKGAGHYPAHLRATLNQPILASAATNTEPQVFKKDPHPNVMAADPLNLMGYYPIADNLYLRYLQWKAVFRS